MERANAYQRNIREIVDIASANYAGNKIAARQRVQDTHQ
ncbi:hypothetical protein CEV32_4147 [Brucella rhizosphaerae]|uniref:Uncharacterized protein n=1 Tax=Brucella rhizosphaerae TaxID=571254 RepID=A0A256FPY7_9HYPH|nr:hypothetical protein CEV32_4147 [Brucella rhizosphaerae]